MVWLQSPPLLRWLLAALIAGAALWTEFGPEPTAAYLFASEHVSTGDILTDQNTAERFGPVGLLATAELGDTASKDTDIDDPILASSVGPGSPIPDGWWWIELELPASARQGNAVRLVLIDVNEVVEAVVARAPIDDPLGGSYGSVAVAPDRAPDVAVAASNGRVAVMIQSQ